VGFDDFPQVTHIITMIETNRPAEERTALLARIAAGIRGIAGQQRCAVARHLHRSGISIAHLQILWLLDEHGPLPIGRLADQLGVAVPNATGLIDRMEQRGLVVRGRVADDRRVVLVSVTDAGRETADQVDGWRASMLERLLQRFAADDLERIADAIDEVRLSFDDHLRAPTTPCLPIDAPLSEETPKS
jgi:DNA-binding MarR family transcriptional regulator